MELMAAPKDPDEYLAAVPEPQRSALEKLRKQIQAVAAEATETITYQMPGFRAHGRPLVSYAAFRDHCSFFPMGTVVIDRYREELKPYLSGRSTLQFDPKKPLPSALVMKIVKARLDENAARRR
jgi:uncharacterized protein YdhG (YjbR/CyaY superfamily)